jgi:hypothetical protein
MPLTPLCQKLQAILSADLTRPCPFVHSRQGLRTPPHTVQDMPGFVVRHSLLETVSSGQRLVGSRTRKSRIGGSVGSHRHTEGFVRSRSLPCRKGRLGGRKKSGHDDVVLQSGSTIMLKPSGAVAGPGAVANGNYVERVRIGTRVCANGKDRLCRDAKSEAVWQVARCKQKDVYL